MKNFKNYKGYALYILLTAGLLTSCGYYKENEIRSNAATGEAQYVVWVMKNTDVIEAYRLPLGTATCHQIDSINAKADSLIIQIKRLKACR